MDSVPKINPVESNHRFNRPPVAPVFSEKERYYEKSGESLSGSKHRVKNLNLRTQQQKIILYQKRRERDEARQAVTVEREEKEREKAEKEREKAEKEEVLKQVEAEKRKREREKAEKEREKAEKEEALKQVEAEKQKREEALKQVEEEKKLREQLERKLEAMNKQLASQGMQKRD